MAYGQLFVVSPTRRGRPSPKLQFTGSHVHWNAFPFEEDRAGQVVHSPVGLPSPERTGYEFCRGGAH